MNLDSILRRKDSKIHFIGIGGVSMSSLAKLLLDDGHYITGSDMNENENVLKLKSCNIDINVGHSKDNIKNCDLVVYTAAISKDNPELKEAERKGILTVERCELLGAVMKKYKYPINISGTHGKTTTTSMFAGVFVDGNKNPTVSIGGDYNKIGGNLKIGEKEYFICEACEYVESFLKFYPYATVILNIEEDHLDYFRDIEHIKSSFLKFANRTDENGFVILNGEDKNCMDIKDKINRKVYTFGLSEQCDCYAKNIEIENGRPVYDLYISGNYKGKIRLSVYGMHNVLNSLATILCADIFGVEFETAKESLYEFTGAKRRFEYKGKFNNAEIYDDYAHHPTEIKTAIESAKKKEYDNLYVVFQPHTYTRTKAFLDEFAEVLRMGENVIITDIYAAREKNTLGITSKDLSDKIPNAKYIGTLESAEEELRKTVKENDLVVTIGAGDVYKIGESLVRI